MQYQTQYANTVQDPVSSISSKPDQGNCVKYIRESVHYLFQFILRQVSRKKKKVQPDTQSTAA